MIWCILLPFILKLEARRQITYTLRTHPAFLSHLNRLAGAANAAVPHDDTVGDFAEQCSPEHVDSLRNTMVHALIRGKVFESSRLLNEYYRIAIDGSGMLTFSRKHCDHCLHKTTKEGVTYYYHPVLEAKLIVPGGIALSVASEFIENPGAEYPRNMSSETFKQDCELKAFKRMTTQLKERFPHMRLCLLLDGLYAAASVLDICRQYGWSYIIVLKQGSIPTLFNEFETLLPLQPNNRMRWKTAKGLDQRFEWSKRVEYGGHTLDIIRCHDLDRDGKIIKQFVWLTNLSITNDTCREITNSGGRLRWCIENQGFNDQKNRGYNMEHAYCE